MKKIVGQRVLLICALAVCATTQTLQAVPYADDIAAIVQRGELRVAICADSTVPPFILMNGDQISGGYDLGLSQAIAQQLGVALKLDQATSYDQAVAFVANGQDDIAVSNLTPTPKRALSVSFTEPYYEFPLVLVAKNNFDMSNFKLSQAVISTDASLNIVAQSGSAEIYYAQLAFPQATVSAYTDLDQAVQGVKNNQYDAVFTDKFTAKQAVFGEESLSIYNLGAEHVDPQTIAVSSSMPHLLIWLNTYLSSVQGNIEQNSLKRNARLA